MDTLLYFLFWGGLFFVFMRFGCGAHIMGHGHDHSHPRETGNEGDEASAMRRRTAPKNDTDPVCGMMIETASAKSSVHDGRVYYFCAEECRQKFEVDPKHFTAKPIPRQQMEIRHDH